MSASLPILHVAYVTLKCETPLSLTTGVDDALFDTLLARDANGLPMIPGTSIAGVLRHLYRIRAGRTATNSLFGIDADEIKARARARNSIGRDSRAPTTAPGANSYEASLLQVSAATLHDQQDRPVIGRAVRLESLRADPVLRHALEEQPIARDQVKISHLGVSDAKARGKFTRAALARGNRFTFELALWSDRRPDSRWNEVRTLLDDTRFRLGGGTRRGFGGIRVVEGGFRERLFDLRDPVDAEAFRQYRRAPIEERLAGFSSPSSTTNRGVERPVVQATMLLQPDDFFRFGAGSSSLGKSQGKIADMLPASEPCVTWQDNGSGGLIGDLDERQAVLPASAIKGAISHRVAFHYNRLAGRFLEETIDCEGENPAVAALFGKVRAQAKDGKPTGQTGRVLIDDLTIEDLDATESVGQMTHNGLDRFTGGTRRGVLYSEELLFRRSFSLSLQILDSDAAELQPKLIRQALTEALADIAEGRLSLGAGAGKGHGYFSAPAGVDWSDQGAWIKGGTA